MRQDFIIKSKPNMAISLKEQNQGFSKAKQSFRKCFE